MYIETFVEVAKTACILTFLPFILHLLLMVDNEHSRLSPQAMLRRMYLYL